MTACAGASPSIVLTLNRISLAHHHGVTNSGREKIARGIWTNKLKGETDEWWMMTDDRARTFDKELFVLYIRSGLTITDRRTHRSIECVTGRTYIQLIHPSANIYSGKSRLLYTHLVWRKREPRPKVSGWLRTDLACASRISCGSWHCRLIGVESPTADRYQRQNIRPRCRKNKQKRNREKTKRRMNLS